MATEKEVTQLLGIFAAFYPRTFEKIDDDAFTVMVMLWSQKLLRYSYAELAVVADRLTTKSKWMPSMAEIINELETIRNPDLQGNAEEEWDAVCQFGGGYGKDPSRYSQLAADTLRLIGGWDRIGNSDEYKELPWIRKEFVELYNQRKQSVKEGKMLPSSEPVLGLGEGTRSGSGMSRLLA